MIHGNQWKYKKPFKRESKRNLRSTQEVNENQLYGACIHKNGIKVYKG